MFLCRKINLKGPYMKKIRLARLVAVILLVVFIVSLIPMLAIARYNYPSADDFVYGKTTHAIWQQTGSLLQTVQAAVKEVTRTYVEWQGSYTAIFLMALQPGVFNAYWLSTFILLGMYILGTCLLGRAVFCKLLKADKWEAVILTVLLMLFSIQLLPQTAEAFYWYNGAVYYTFVYGLGLVYVALHVSGCAKGSIGTGKLAGMILLAALIGGGNFCLLLPLLAFTLLLTAYSFYKKNKTAIPFAITWAVLFIGFLVNFLAPGNKLRQAEVTTGQSAIKSVLMSLGFELQDFVRWIDFTVILGFIIAIPVMIKIINRMKFSFPYPIVVSFISYCIYAMQYTAQYYATGNIWTGRLYAQLYYTFYWMVGLNVFYWLGWLISKVKMTMGQEAFATWSKNVFRYLRGYTLPILALCGALTISSFYVLNRKTSPGYSAFQDLKNGNAQQYAAEMQARMKLYEDPTILEVEVEPLTVKPYVLFFNDFSQSADDWRAEAVRAYYNKLSVTMTEN